MDNQTRRREFLIKYMLDEKGMPTDIPADEYSQKRLLRGLFNVRMPEKASKEFIEIQDQYLQEELRRKGITELEKLPPALSDDIYLWQGDITTLKCDAIVNAANSQYLGCFCPNHGCIDNAIHTFAGIQLRQECANIMEQNGNNSPPDTIITKAYNLPCKYILHTVGPIVYGQVTKTNERQLENCYKNCLAIADEYHLKSIAFCCISTGEFHFPNDYAAEIAVKTVLEYKNQTFSKIKVLFNVFKDLDYEIYTRILGKIK